MKSSTPLDVIVVGAGFSGLYQLHALKQAGFNTKVIEAGSGYGGVWQNNRYPGARVDTHVPNYEYSLDTVWRDWVWSERFPGRDELLAYFDHVVDVLALAQDIELNTRVAGATFDKNALNWHVRTSSGDVYECRILVFATGFGSAPYTPDIPGLCEFRGVCCHTASWPSDLDLTDKRVGVIGTGASGVQVVQEASKTAAHLTVFQRTPINAIPMQQKCLTEHEQAQAKQHYPEIFRARNAPPTSFFDIHRRNDSALAVSESERTAVFEEAWQKGGFHFWVGTFKDILTNENANKLAYKFWRDKTRARIEDPETAERLAPTEPIHPFGTKRPSLEQDYYECFNQTNVDLVDLRETPITRVTQSSVLVGEDTQIDVDVLVLATGFDASTGGLTAIDIRGSSGRTLAQAWSNGVDTHLGMAIHDFPNLLMLYGPQSAASFCNGPVCAEIQGDWIVELLLFMKHHNHSKLEADLESGLAWTQELQKVADKTLFGKADSWYMGANIPGKRRQLLNTPNSDAYLEHLAQCASSEYSGFQFE